MWTGMSYNKGKEGHIKPVWQYTPQQATLYWADLVLLFAP